MKKFISFALAMLLILSTLVGCGSNTNGTTDNAEGTQNGTQTYGPDAWDGSVASSFDGGDGSETDPYRIATAEQLAFLASEINSGKNYTGKHFALMADLDLAEVPWTPIGNGTYSFDAHLNGNEHIIKNLRVNKGESYNQEYSHTTSKQYVSGLFGSCVDCCITNLTISGADITVSDADDRDYIYVGILCGKNTINDGRTEISNINIENASINIQLQQRSVTTIATGGITGYFYALENTVSNISNVYCDVSVSFAKGLGVHNYAGSTVGYLSTLNVCNIQNCASYLNVDIDNEYRHGSHNYFGAFGGFSTLNEFISITNIFSKVTVNKIYDLVHGYPAYSANAIIGEKEERGKESEIDYEIKNAFGNVEQFDMATGEKKTETRLHELAEDLYTETNCKGCDALPVNHGFDTNIWDVSDPAKPVLK